MDCVSSRVGTGGTIRDELESFPCRVRSCLTQQTTTLSFNHGSPPLLPVDDAKAFNRGYAKPPRRSFAEREGLDAAGLSLLRAPPKELTDRSTGNVRKVAGRSGLQYLPAGINITYPPRSSTEFAVTNVIHFGFDKPVVFPACVYGTGIRTRKLLRLLCVYQLPVMRDIVADMNLPALSAMRVSRQLDPSPLAFISEFVRLSQ